VSLFSQRKGIRPIAKALQVESIDDDLRNGFWNGLTTALWALYEGFRSSEQIDLIAKQIWLDYFKRPVDELPPFHIDYGKAALAGYAFRLSLYDITRKYFLTDSEWWQVYDLVEFLVQVTPADWKDRLKEELNRSLEAENAAYRIVGDEVVEITDQNEIEAIETALGGPVNAARSHLERALELLSDREQPDYRNSIKESISAVEAVCQVLTGMPKATLGECIKVVKNYVAVHPALEKAFSNLYGYTSDAGGIRHALTDESFLPTYADAKFMLVACSAFVNFLWAKAAELGIPIPAETP